MTYIALDGPAPRAKMIQQRSRRFKATLDKQFIIELKKKFKMNNNENEGWDGSANISPGTKFMEKLSNRIISAMKDKTFVKHNSQMKIIFNNGNSPGEGEHKFLDILRNMRTMESKKNDMILNKYQIIPKDTTSKKPYNIVRALKEMKQYVQMKGYAK